MCTHTRTRTHTPPPGLIQRLQSPSHASCSTCPNNYQVTNSSNRNQPLELQLKTRIKNRKNNSIPLLTPSPVHRPRAAPRSLSPPFKLHARQSLHARPYKHSGMQTSHYNLPTPNPQPPTLPPPARQTRPVRPLPQGPSRISRVTVQRLSPRSHPPLCFRASERSIAIV